MSYLTEVRGLKLGSLQMVYRLWASYLTEVRGLKLKDEIVVWGVTRVVPHRGTWIEMRWFSRHSLHSSVVPHRGTWIEILMVFPLPKIPRVVPHRGTWIEIGYVTMGQQARRSYLTEVRGLKLRM